jgi:hypothetical protein
MVQSPEYPPLSYPDGWPAPPSALERICYWIPIIGWAIAGNLDAIRLGPGVRHVRALLAKRPKVLPDLWKSTEHAEVAATIAAICQEVIGWKTANFIPEDPFEIMIELRTGDLCEVEALMKIDDTFKIKLPFDGVMKMTFADVVDYCLEHRTQH